MKILTLTGVKNNFPVKLGESITTMTSMETVKLRHLELTSDICREVLRGLSACSKLKCLSICGIVLTDYLSYLFMESNHHRFPLEIMDARLSTGDVANLANAVNRGKLPQLKKLDLSQNILTHKVGILMGFYKGKYVIYPALQTLSFAKCMLNQAGLRSIHEALARNWLPKMQDLNLRCNTLTNCIIDLFGEELDSSFSSLIELNLSCTELSATDLRNLSRALSQAVMSNCKTLDLSENRLTGILSELFTGNGLPFVNTLKLEDTQLDIRDIENIIDVIKASKLPTLTDLRLRDRKIVMYEDQVQKLLIHQDVHRTIYGYTKDSMVP